MKKLSEYTRIIRSKNAGPLYLTLDLIFDSRESFEYIRSRLTPQMVGEAYETDAAAVSVIPFETVNAVKITFPRKIISGAVGDDDVYGCQKHVPLSEIMI